MDKELEKRLSVNDFEISNEEYMIKIAFYLEISKKALRAFNATEDILEVQKQYEISDGTDKNTQLVIDSKDTYYHHYLLYKDRKFKYEDLIKSLYNIEKKNPILKNMFKDITRSNMAGRVADLTFAMMYLKKEPSFEELLDWIARSSGSRSEFSITPLSINKLMVKLAGSFKGNITVYDPAVGTANLLLNVDSENFEKNKYYGQDINKFVLEIAKMNAILQDINSKNIELRLGDSLNSNWNFGKADVVVADMPLAMSWRPSKDLEQDNRYKNYGKLPNKNEWPFILEGLDKLSDDGTMIALSAQGILFRAAKEYKVRRKLLEDGMIKAVILLPEKLYYGTSVATCLLVLKKSSKDRDVFFINASKEYQKVKSNNVLTDDNIGKIVDAFNNQKEVKNFSRKISFEEIQKNDFNLTMARYINQYQFQEKLNQQKEFENLTKIDNKIGNVDEELNKIMRELVTDDKLKEVEKLIK
ncbi:MAG TPA: methyltransferase domain-containing protein [Lactobacillus sp.]|uniref:N-6 DNA methylase n=1 Tax=Ligilactobacillus salivarius TaxID=1624 RepID=UPI000666C575|nr:N-6 DNA methylase [Ligilactobacillus salivarius]MDU7057871.1 N-6 DNA methylase [Ligilactobacillus salivarius]MYZ24657.1 N-6 DNA methylase [Ligilactobacillus salivarius]HBU67137.1 methyltransferase domain-containing protein [Lactobacillus sp.]